MFYGVIGYGDFISDNESSSIFGPDTKIKNLEALVVWNVFN